METPREPPSRREKLWMLLGIVLIPLFLVSFWAGVFFTLRALFT
jgi:hypothetical protein